MPRITAGHAIVDVLRAEGVEQVFGLPGGHVLSIYDALYDASDIHHVLVRHEHAAGAMAAGYAQLTGRPGICLVTAGPGCTNLLTAVAEAYVGSLPMIILSGRGATATTHRGASQEVATDQIFAPVTKWSVRIDRADLVADVLRQAFALAVSGRPGPVLVDVPRDILDTEIEAKPYLPVERPGRPPADAARVAAAAAALVGAERPIIVAGGGAQASDASEAVIALASRYAIPVLTSLAGRGIIPDDHPLSAGGLGAHRTKVSKQLLGEADVILGLGCRFEEMETNWSPAAVPSPDATYIQVDIEPAEIGRSIPARIGLVGDVRAVVEQLTTALAEQPGIAPVEDLAADARVRGIADGLASLEAEAALRAGREGAPMHPLRAIGAVRDGLPRDGIAGFDVGCLAQHIAGATPYFKVYGPRSTIVPSSFYGMGFVAAAFPVARIVYPDRPAVCFVGDGSFQMVMNILPVAAEHGLGVTWVVLNDGALGSIRDIQEYRFGNRILGTDFDVEPDLAAIARACGCHGERIEDPDDADGAVARALEANERGVPALLDFAVSRDRLLGTLEHYTFYPEELVERYRRGEVEELSAGRGAA